MFKYPLRWRGGSSPLLQYIHPVLRGHKNLILSPFWLEYFNLFLLSFHRTFLCWEYINFFSQRTGVSPRKLFLTPNPSSPLNLGGCSVPPVGFAPWIETLACVQWDRNINKNKITRRKSNAVPHPWGAGEEQHHWSCLISPPLHRIHYNFFILREDKRFVPKCKHTVKETK